MNEIEWWGIWSDKQKCWWSLGEVGVELLWGPKEVVMAQCSAEILDLDRKHWKLRPRRFGPDGRPM